MSTNSGGTGRSRTMKASEFKAKCLGLMDEVAENGGEIVITKNGKPMAKLTAFHDRPRSLFGAGRGRMEILGRHHQSFGCRMGGSVRSGPGDQSMTIADTHTLVWLWTGDEQLDPDPRRTRSRRICEAALGVGILFSSKRAWPRAATPAGLETRRGEQHCFTS